MKGLEKEYKVLLKSDCDKKILLGIVVYAGFDQQHSGKFKARPKRKEFHSSNSTSSFYQTHKRLRFDQPNSDYYQSNEVTSQSQINRSASWSSFSISPKQSFSSFPSSTGLSQTGHERVKRTVKIVYENDENSGPDSRSKSYYVYFLFFTVVGRNS